MINKTVIENQRTAKSWNRSGGAQIRKVLLYVIITIIAFIYILPGLGVILTSFKLDAEIAQDGLWSFPKLLHLDNYKEIWFVANIQTYMKNSLLVTLPATFISITLGVLMGYVFSKLPFKGSEVLFVFVLAGLFFPPQIVLIPLFKFYNKVNLYDTLWPLIITHAGFGLPICTLIMRNFISSIPMAIREAAIIDGASELDVLVRVILPISLPALAVLATLQFTWIWNDFLYPIIFTQSDNMRTVMVGLISMRGQYSVAYGAQGAMAVVASIPTLIIFVFFQQYFIKGMTMGSVKG
jgi:ABC-type glycerol-3-phosphate transport system permease component